MGELVVTVVGVHGIAQQRRGRAQLLDEWRPALQDGIEIATRQTPPEISFDIAFYGDVFRPHPDPDTSKSAAEDELADLSDAELEDLNEAVGEAVTPQQLAEAREEQSKGVHAVPGPLAAALRAIDAKFGPAAGVLYLGELRHVRRYLREEELKARVDAVVAAKMANGASILIGHSLGSVVAFEFARQNPEHHLDLLVTLGSPLALRMVRCRMPDQAACGRVPTSVNTWVNVRDRGDPVTLGGDLAHWWPGVKDRHVDNGRKDAHGIGPYLTASETGSAIATALHLG